MPNGDYDNESFQTDDEALLEVLESEGDWESDDNGFAEARRSPRYQPKYAGRKGTRIPQPRPARPVGGLTGGAINTPAGKAQFRFEKPVATKEAVDNLAKELKKEIQLNAEAIRKVDQTLDRNTSMLDKKITALEAAHKKAQQQGQMSMLLPLLLSKPPAIEKVTVGTITDGVKTGSVVPITDTTYKKEDSSFLLFAMMSMGGNMGGSGSDGFSSMLPFLLLSGSFGK